ncbi:MAG: cation:proton antiporter [Elusimicrobiota bacterium]|jgi:CPA2 family monovalent cation:H+ antiporter-2|nr:cation:proton antiporter [Elusimicrobiota bacterium]
MEHYQLLGILAIGFVFALLFGYITQRIGLSSIVGYLIAGFCIGSSTPGFIADTDLAFQLSEAGVVLLMFGVGLHFDLKDLLSVKTVAIPGAIAQSGIAAFFGTFIGTHLGLSFSSSLILGLGLAVASTVVLIRVLTDNNVIGTIQGNIAVGWLVVEDILTILILVILPTLAGVLLTDNQINNETLHIVKAAGLALLRLCALWVIVVEIGGRFIPWLLSKIAKTRSQELFTLAVLVMAFTTAVIAAYTFQASLALGAFLGGMVVGRTKMSHQAGADILPLKDAFAVLFFLSVGMLLNPRFIIEYPILIAACLGIVILIKPLTALIVVTILGYSPKTSLIVAASLAQVGEFSFILAQEAKRLGLAEDAVYNAIVVSAIVSITLNPTIFKQIPRFSAFLSKKEKIWKALSFFAERKSNKKNKIKKPDFSNLNRNVNEKTAIVVGYGPAGQKVSETLIENGINPTIIEMNIDTVINLTKKSISAVYGNSSKKEVLQAAGIDNASYLIITVPNLDVTTATASLASILNPDARILARSRFLNTEEYLKQIGVADIAFEEEEVSKGLAALVLDHLNKQRIKEAQEAAKENEDNNTIP